MAQYTITLALPVRCFGSGPSTLWGSSQPMKWGVSYWGQQPGLMVKQPGKAIANAEAMTDAWPRQTGKVIAGSLAALGTLSSLSAIDQAGYSLSFPDRTTNAAREAVNPYAKASDPAPTFAKQATNSTTWTKQ